MNKISFSDIQPNNTDGRSVRDIQLSENADRQRRSERHAERRMPEYADGASPDQYQQQPRERHGSFIIWTSALIILAALVIISTFIFIGRTTIDLTIRVAHIDTTDNIVHSAYKNPEDTELGFTVVSTTAEVSESIPATETKFVEQKSSGKITVYNDYSSRTQRLIKNTRFEAPDGKIYRVRNSLMVPGYKKNADGSTTPGTIEVTVYADKAGEEYNKESTNFTIPGLKGDDRFDKFWAKSSGVLSGGFSGNRSVVGESDLSSKREELRSKLRENIKENLATIITKDQTLFSQAIFITYESKDEAEASGKNVKVTESATAQAIVFNSTALAKELAKASSILLYEGDKTLVNPDSVTFSIIQKEKVDPTQDELIQFTVSGDAKLLWDVDVDTLKQELSGKPSSVLDSTLAAYPGVKDAYVTIRPFWRTNFPTDLDDIDVQVETQK